MSGHSLNCPVLTSASGGPCTCGAMTGVDVRSYTVAAPAMVPETSQDQRGPARLSNSSTAEVGEMVAEAARKLEMARAGDSRDRSGWANYFGPKLIEALTRLCEDNARTERDYTELRETYDKLFANKARLEGDLATAKRRAAPVGGADLNERRAAAKKLLCDICACSAEADPESLDLPHVVSGCLEPLETLIFERDASLFLAQECHKYIGRDGYDIFDALREKAAANERAREAAARADKAEADLSSLKARVAEVLEPIARRCAEAVRPDDADSAGVTVRSEHLRRAAELHAALTGKDRT